MHFNVWFFYYVPGQGTCIPVPWQYPTPQWVVALGMRFSRLLSPCLLPLLSFCSLWWCRRCSLSDWFFLKMNYSVCRCRFGIKAGGGFKFSLLCHLPRVWNFSTVVEMPDVAGKVYKPQWSLPFGMPACWEVSQLSDLHLTKHGKCDGMPLPWLG